MRVAFAALILFASIAGAGAQTHADVSACHHDAVRYCGVEGSRNLRLMPWDEKLRVGLCLFGHIATISPTCVKAFAEHGLSH